jgi:predicted amidohydrolase
LTRIALFQSTTGIDPVSNAAALVNAVTQAASGGAKMVFTPEMCGLLDGDRERSGAIIRSEADDDVLRAVRAAAKARGIWVHLGSLALISGGGKRVNRTFVIDPAGDVVGRYDKMHLFDVDLPTGESWRESAVYEPGLGPVVVRGTPVGSLGLTICYDLRFPAIFERLSEAGAEVIAVPAAFTVPTGLAHWHVLLRARAIEAGLFVVAAAQWGHHEDGRTTFGHSLVVDPWGEVLIDGGEGEKLLFADLDLSRIAEVRSRIPVMSHRRTIGPVSD